MQSIVLDAYNFLFLFTVRCQKRRFVDRDGHSSGEVSFLIEYGAHDFKLIDVRCPVCLAVFRVKVYFQLRWSETGVAEYGLADHALRSLNAISMGPAREAELDVIVTPLSDFGKRHSETLSTSWSASQYFSNARRFLDLS